MNTWTSNTWINIKLTFRDKQTLFWNYAFPLFFLFLFGSVFARGQSRVMGVLLAGLLCISAMSAGFFGMSIGLVTARERGILRRYRLTPIKPWVVISSEVVSSLLVLLSTLLLQIALAKAFYHVHIEGSLAALSGTLALGALAFLSLGFVIAGVAENTKVAQIFGNLLFFPLMFLGGAAIPFEFLPPHLRRFAHLIPSTYMVDGLRQIITGQAGMSGNLVNAGVLLATAGVSTVVAAKLFRWESNEPLSPSKKLWVLAIPVIFIVAALWAKQTPPLNPAMP